MAIERLGFVDHLILMAENSRCEATKRSGLSFIEGKVASLIDRVLAVISSSYREYRLNLLNSFTTAQPQNAHIISEVARPILIPVTDELTEQTPKDEVLVPLTKSEDKEQVDSNEEDLTGDSDVLDDGDLSKLFGFFEEELPVSEIEKEKGAVETEEVVVTDSKPVLPLVENGTEGTANLDTEEMEKALDKVEEKSVVTATPVDVDHPILPEPEPTPVMTTEQAEDMGKLKSSETREEVLTEESFFAMAQLLWLKEGEAFADLPDNLKKQFGTLLVNSPGLLAGFLMGFQAIDYQEKYGWSVDIMEDAFGDMDADQLFNSSEEYSDVESLEDEASSLPPDSTKNKNQA
ncbi:hypothetical protein PNK_1107 [Candidatus Protochlamydia naegleriophila]|uniref:Uncharacterized protein n=1 Tax=Candidatus Protochlamydia naegleriophila TaxID=389348 RepID=A0A0U5JD59_9BACT|nr:hypothetical protein [Candidatus Protochlamydia naegleriophila]CUI16724.1 hypothetical protein PNK_1107 [Candidatus Protochlamydia naegleriophila]